MQSEPHANIVDPTLYGSVVVQAKNKVFDWLGYLGVAFYLLSYGPVDLLFP